MNRPQTIQIFLPDGSPRSVKIAELTNRVVKAVLVPRNKIDYISNRDELKNVGIYFLFGESADKAKPLLYIGEAEDCLDRIKQHNKSKDFWNYAVVMVSKINAFTKSHAKYLEHISVIKAKESNRFEIENSTIPTKSFVTESMEADLLDSFETMTILLATLGFPVFEKVGKAENSNKDYFILNGRGITAEGDLIDDGFVIYKGSQAKIDTVPSCPDYIIALRNKLLEEKILVQKEGHLLFEEDYIFGSPSTAAGVAWGRSTNGWVNWKNEKSKTLDQIKRQ